ncbi:MAG: hypothetical protein J5716_04550 [Alphaproteobacteria bacterium]|nr:hypothetical protein [Alphaproteobacteria bacterium]
MKAADYHKARQRAEMSYPDEKPVVDIDLSQCPVKDRPRMIALVNRLAKSPAGLEMLTFAAENGYHFNFMTGSSTANGVMSECGKRISLNPHRSDAKLVSTLCHECRHAFQHAHSSVLDEEHNLDVQSNILYKRAMEADAQAYAIRASKELALQGDLEPYYAFKKHYPEIEKAFDQAYQAADNEITNEVMTKTFESWYDQDCMKAVYENTYILKPMLNDLTWIQKGVPGKEFNRAVSAQQTIQEITQTKDGNYFTDDPEILNTSKYKAVTEKTAEQIEKYVQYRKEMTGDDVSAILKGIQKRPNVPAAEAVEMKKPEPEPKKSEDKRSARQAMVMNRLKNRSR